MTVDCSNPLRASDYQVAHGTVGTEKGLATSPPAFILIQNAGVGEADGVYKPGERRWCDCDVYQNRFGDCIISREAHKSPKTGEVKHGFVLGRDGRPLYGVKTEKQAVPTKNWRVFQGHEPVPEILVFGTWTEACQHGAWYFAQEAENAAKGGHWKVVLMMADRAFDLHTCARPKGRGDARNGGLEWCEQLSELLACRSDALLHLGEFRRALVDACAAVHFIPAFEWSKARTRGIAACMNLGVEEQQAKLLIEEMCKRADRDFPGVRALEPIVDSALERAKSGKLKEVVLHDEVPDDGRLYFRILDPEDCKLHAAPDWGSKVLGSRNFNDIVRGAQLLKSGMWLELHTCEAYDDSGGHRKSFMPVFAQPDQDGDDEREEILERLKPHEYPRLPQWERMGLSLKPLGLKPPPEAEFAPDYGRWKDSEKPPNQKEWPFIYKHGLALACMVRGAPDFIIDSFVRWHWISGWNHIFLFFDDPDDAGIAHAKVLEDFGLSKKAEGIGLTLIKMDADWWSAAKSTSRFFVRREKNDAYESVCKACEARDDVESKQLVAFDLALQQAHKMGMDWFAHVDIDECVYAPKLLDNSMRRYLGSRERGIEGVRLWNHEAVPEGTQCQDWFRECTLFQINRQHCQGFDPPREYDQLLRKREGRELEAEKSSTKTRWWSSIMGAIHLKRQAVVRRLKLGLPPPPLGVVPDVDGLSQAHETFVSFSAYTCGKSVVRLQQHVRPPVPCGLHSFLADTGELLKYEQAKSREDPVILHYPNASLSFWRDKYERLGEITGDQEMLRRLPRMHLASSQLVLHGQKHQQEMFYRTVVMQSEYNELAYMAEHGLVIRVEGVKELLEYYDQPRDMPELLPGQVRLHDLQSGLKFGRA